MLNDRLAYKSYEIIGGKKIMSPSPVKHHMYIMINICLSLGAYLKGKKKGRIFTDNMDVHLPDGNLVKPDLFVLCDRKIMKDKLTVYGAPDFVVEILSRATMRKDLTVKKDLYEKNGVREYWIVNPFDKSVTVYHLREGKLELDDIYTCLTEDEFNQLDEEEKAEIKTDIKLSIFDDLTITVKEIFDDIED